VRAAWLALLLAAGCDPVWSLRARVRAPEGRPLAEAALALTCRPEGRGRAALTDERGEASFGGLGWELPAGCEVTVARPGFRTHRTSFEALCAPRKLAECHRAREVEVTLEPVAAQ
jgi:hypothetical protein